MALTELNYFEGGGGVASASGVITSADWTSLDSSGEAVITGLGFKPKKIYWYTNPSSQYHCFFNYDEDLSDSVFKGFSYNSWKASQSIGSASEWNRLESVDADGFTLARYESTYGSDMIYWTATAE